MKGITNLIPLNVRKNRRENGKRKMLALKTHNLIIGQNKAASQNKNYKLVILMEVFCTPDRY